LFDGTRQNRFRGGRLTETIGGMVVVRKVSPGEWESLRDVRLAALREAPFTQEQWRYRR
jgi:hypothetical protein